MRALPASLPFHMRIRHIELQQQRAEAFLISDLEAAALKLPRSRVLSPINTPQIAASPVAIPPLPSPHPHPHPRPLMKPGLCAYLEPLWPPKCDVNRQRRERVQTRKRNLMRRERERKRREEDNNVGEEIAVRSKAEDPSFLWRPFFRMASGGFSLRGRDSLASTTFYKNYVERHSFAFKNAGIYYIESYPSTRRFYGVALDL